MTLKLDLSYQVLNSTSNLHFFCLGFEFCVLIDFNSFLFYYVLLLFNDLFFLKCLLDYVVCFIRL
jgi:hypothetical protein